MKTMIKNIAFVLLIFLCFSAQAQEKTLKEQAIESFKAEHYDKAINLLKQALIQSPDDAEIYYYLGFFNHYRANDSRPLKGYNYAYSAQVLEYLDKAIALNPNYGDAKYFYSAECGSLAMLAMQNYDAEKVKYYYELASKKGTFPDWLIEFGKNLLSSCEKNAILFTGGDADFNICSYLQIVENFRTDVTVIPIGLIDRPWYISFLKKGLENSVRKINIDLTEEQIMDIRPFKWKETNVYINISPADRLKFALPDDYKIEWTVVPDLWSYRMHSKIEEEEATKRTYLSPQRAILLQIVEDNLTERPIHFSMVADPFFWGGLNVYFQNYGMSSRIIPVRTNEIVEFSYNFNNSENAYNIDKIEKLLQPENFQHFPTIKTNDMPRVSGSMFIYHTIINNLAQYYKQNNRQDKLQELLTFYKSNIAIDWNKERETHYLNAMKKE